MLTRILRRPTAWLLGGLCALCVVTAYARRPGEQKTQRIGKIPAAGGGGGALTGHVAVPAGQRLPEMIVFLESTDPSFTFTPPSDAVVISQHHAKFHPMLVVVPVGTRVDFRNDEHGPVAHNVFSNSEAKKFDLGLYQPDEPVEPVLFDRAGPVRLRCSIHRYMDGVVYVTPTPYFAAVGKDGGYSIEGIKPGTYRLKTWQRSQRYPEQDLAVVVAAGGKMVEVKLQMSRK